MSERSFRFKAKVIGNSVEAKLLISHPMETGLRKNRDTKELVPAHFIQELKIEKEGHPLLDCIWGRSISSNPFLSFRFKGNVGDKLTATWLDNLGETQTQSAVIK